MIKATRIARRISDPDPPAQNGPGCASPGPFVFPQRFAAAAVQTARRSSDANPAGSAASVRAAPSSRVYAFFRCFWRAIKLFEIACARLRAAMGVRHGSMD